MYYLNRSSSIILRLFLGLFNELKLVDIYRDQEICGFLIKWGPLLKHFGFNRTVNFSWSKVVHKTAFGENYYIKQKKHDAIATLLLLTIICAIKCNFQGSVNFSVSMKRVSKGSLK